MKTVSAKLAEFVAGISIERLPPEVVDKAKACILHGLGIALASRDYHQARIADAAIAEGESAPRTGSTCFLSGKKAGPGGAAFANGVLFQCRGQSDAYHTAAHFGPAVIPAVLALAEQRGSSGGQILAAVVAGYEVAAALARDHIELTVSRGWRGSPTYGVLGSVAASAKLDGLDTEQIANALGFAACFTFGNVECNISHTMESHFELGLAARNGLLASSIARHQGRAAPTAIEGKAGFLNLFAGTTDFQEKITEGLGKRFEILDVTFKRYAIGMLAQSSTYLAISMAMEENLKPEEIEKVILELNPFEAYYPGKGRREEHAHEGRGGRTAHALAVALTYRSATRDLLRRRDNPSLVPLHDKISIKAADDVAPLCARLTIKARGEEYSRELTDGSKTHSFSFNNTVELIRDLRPEMRVSAENLDRLVEVIDRLESATDIGQLITVATAPAG